MSLKPLGLDPARCLIAGYWVEPATRQTRPLIDPSDGSTLCEIACGGTEDIDRAVQAAEDALAGDWGRLTAAERGRILAKTGQLVLENTEHLAELEARDVGKPLKQARADVIALARYMEFYAGAADKLHGTTIPYLDGVQ